MHRVRTGRRMPDHEVRPPGSYICLNRCENGRLTVRFSLRPFTFTVACPRKSRATDSIAPALTIVELGLELRPEDGFILGNDRGDWHR